MTDDEMILATRDGVPVKVINHDYEFYGHIAIIWNKLRKVEGKSSLRCVIENVDGVSLIQSSRNLEAIVIKPFRNAAGSPE